MFSRRFLLGAGIVLAAIVSLLVLPVSRGVRPAAQVASESTPAVVKAHDLTDPSWARLTLAQQEFLSPLRSVWSGMNVHRQMRWQLVANRAAKKSEEVKLRLKARMQAWASLTPEERARTRLSFLRSANHYGPTRRSHSWVAYQSHRCGAPAFSPAAALAKPISPALAQAPRGATTMLMTRIYALPADDKVARLDLPEAGATSTPASAGASEGTAP